MEVSNQRDLDGNIIINASKPTSGLLFNANFEKWPSN